MIKQLPLYVVSAIAIIFITLLFYERDQAKKRIATMHEEVVKTAFAPMIDMPKPVEHKPTELVEGPVGITPPTLISEQEGDINDSVAAAVDQARPNKLDQWTVRMNPQTNGNLLYPSQSVNGSDTIYKSAKTAKGNLKSSLAIGCDDFVLMAESNYDVSNITCNNLYGAYMRDGSGIIYLAKLSYKGKQYAFIVPVDNQGRHGDMSLEPWE